MTIHELANKLKLTYRQVSYLLHKNKIHKEQSKITEANIRSNLANLGVKCTLQLKEVSEKARQTCLKKYGKRYALQNKEIYQKLIDTNLKKYNVKSTSQVEEFIKKRKDTCIKKYGVDNAVKNKEIREKINKTKALNKTFTISKSENIIYNKLLEKFPNVKRQYKSEKYPFNCDFYLPEKDLYIEYQGYWNHNTHPFDDKDSNDLYCLQNWKKQSETKPGYSTAIDVWTVRDPHKRCVVKENNLNWIEFFNMKEFEEWYKGI